MERFEKLVYDVRAVWKEHGDAQHYFSMFWFEFCVGLEAQRQSSRREWIIRMYRMLCEYETPAKFWYTAMEK
jgi:hypothetical protein